MSFWSKAFGGKQAEEDMMEVTDEQTRPQKRSVESPPKHDVTKNRRSSRNKKAHIGPSPNKGNNGQAGNIAAITPGTELKNDSYSSSIEENTSRDSVGEKIVDGLRKQFLRLVSEIQFRRPKEQTEDTFIHAMAVLLEIPINFNDCNMEIKTKLLNDIIFLISDPAFKRDTLYSYNNMDAIADFVYIPPPKSAKPSYRAVKSSVDQMIHALITKKGKPVHDIPTYAWDAMCQITGIFLSPNSLPSLAKVTLIQKIISIVDANKFKKRSWYNRHAISTLLFYYGFENRPVANTSEDKIIPPLFTDKSFSIDARKAGFYQWSNSQEHKRPASDYSKYKTDEWCASETLCNVDIFDALSSFCEICSFPVHPQCASYISQKYFCHKCKPDYSRQCWSCFASKYIELPSQEVEHKDEVESDEEPFDSEESMIAKETPESYTANNAVQQNISDNKVQQTSLQEASMNADMAEVNNPDELEQDHDPMDDTEIVQSPSDTKNSDRGKFNLTSVLNEHSSQGFSAEVRRKLNLDDVSNTNDENLEFIETRADLTLNIQERLGSDESTVIRSIKPFIEALFEIDANARILPWKEKAGVKRLDIDELAHDYDAIQVYFNRARLRDDSIKIYSDVRIAHVVPWDAISISMRDWLQNNKCGIYYKKLQVENTRTLGWFLWSHRNIKADKLAHVLANDHDLHLYFRYSKIYLGRGEKFGPDEGVKALIAVCESKDYRDYSKVLKVIYHQSSKDFPLGIKLRFMPQTTNEDEDILLLQQLFRAQQEQWLTTLNIAFSSDIRLLDASIQSRKTLRNHIMNMKHSDLSPLFVCVDSQWNNGSRFIFTFIESHEQEAKRMVNTLAAYLIKKKGEDVIPYFTTDAIEFAKTLHWDEKRQYFMTEDESYYREMDIWTDDLALQLNSEEVTARIVSSITNEKAKQRIERIYTGEETCSVGTVNSKVKKKRLSGRMESDSEAETQGDNDSVTTTDTNNSNAKVSTKDKVQKLEKELKLMTANQKTSSQVLFDMSAILDRLQNKFLGESTAPSKSKSVRIQSEQPQVQENNTDMNATSEKQKYAEGTSALGAEP